MNCGKKRLAAWLTAAATVLSLLPGSARAEEVWQSGLPEAWPGSAWQLEEKESAQPSRQPEEEAGPRLYFGLLHSHTADSSGTGTPAEAYAYAAETAGLDFLAVTDHSNSFDGAREGVLTEDGAVVSTLWKQGREAAEKASNEKFLALYGFEMTWHNGLGHIGTLFTPGFLSREQEAFTDPATALENYYTALNTVPGSVSQFHHPDILHGDFENFGHYSEEADNAMQLLEVISEGTLCLDAYDRALAAGWHVAPTASQNNHNGQWGDADSCRTVVYAENLSGQAFADALKNRRVYATGDADLEILYTLDGHLFGSVIRKQTLGETVVLTASFRDPTDEAIGTVAVIAEGEIAAEREVSGSDAELSFELPSDCRYYYLRITQADGDIAVTAPVWIEGAKPAEITSFTSDRALAIRNRPVGLRVEVRNRDGKPFAVERVSFFLAGQEIGSLPQPAAIPGNTAGVYETELFCDAAGQAQIRVTVSGSIAGEPMECTACLNLTFLTEDLVTTVVADGSHGQLPGLTELEALAAGHRVALVQTASLTPEILSSCDCLLIPAPERDWEPGYGTLIADYLRSGRTLILCGQADRVNPECAARLNALLQHLGLTARFRDDTAYDPVNNGGQPERLIATVYHENEPLVSGSGQPWHQNGGCTVDPGQGVWLVKGLPSAFSVDADRDGTGALEQTYTETVDGRDVVHSLVTLPGEAVLLGREETAFGGNVFLSGGVFCGDETLDPGGENPWDRPNGNALLMEAILEIPRETLPLSTTAQAKAAGEGETVRVRAYVTAGTAVEGNRFPDMIYVQDSVGGLGVTGFTEPGVSVGTPLELYLIREGDSFRLLHAQTLEDAHCNLQPEVLSCADAGNHARCGEMLVKTEGTVVSRTLTPDGKGVSAFTLEDREGGRIVVRIEDCIRSASTGENTLAQTVEEGGWVSAVGIVYRTDGQTVLRVRNCDEILCIREPDRTYRVLKGEYSVWIRNEGGSLYMEVEGPGEEFLGIEVDGERIDKGHYQTTDAGKLKFRFWPRYLRTLELGTHSVVFRFRGGEAKATLVVWTTADNPYTGDPLLPRMGLMVLSGSLLAALRRKRKQR